jgi:hypothetical protein
MDSPAYGSGELQVPGRARLGGSFGVVSSERRLSRFAYLAERH